MQLRHIEPGAKMSVFVKRDDNDAGEKYEAVFRYLESDMHFIVKCQGLYDKFDSLVDNTDLRISIPVGPYSYFFLGRVLAKQRISGMLMLEQRTEFTKVANRVYERDELHIQVRVAGLPVPQFS